jgi:putative ABC transport system permease protein
MILRDLSFTLRLWRKNPFVTAVNVLVMALGVGATTLAFSLVNGVLLRPLPYPEAQQLVAVDESAPQRDQPSMGVAFPNFQDMRARNRSLVELAAYSSRSVTLGGLEEAVRIPAAGVSAGLFRVLRVQPIHGRAFLPEEDHPNAPRVALLGYGPWTSYYGSDPSIVGKTIQVDGQQVTVVGVMPEDFHFPSQSDLWLPLSLDPASATRTDYFLAAIGRLKPKVSVVRAGQDLRSIMRQIAQENPATDLGQTVNVVSFHHQVASGYRTEVLTLFGAVLFVLLIACANIANLLLVQAADRTREIAIRGALGASRGTIVRQLLIESLLLGALGAVAGLALSRVGVPGLIALIPFDLPRWMHFETDYRILLFAVAAALLTSLLTCLAPAQMCSRMNLTSWLKEGGRSGMTGIRSQRLRHALLVGEVALSLALLIGAGLMARSFLALSATPIGFDPRHLLTLQASMPTAKYPEPERARTLVQRLREEVGSLPGVTSVAVTSGVPLISRWGRSLTVEDHPLLSVREAPMVNNVVTTPGYFRTLGISLLAGRDFADADSTGPPVTIVDEGIARQYWPGASAIGKRVRFGPPESQEPWHTVVGVAGAVRNQTLLSPGRPSVYLPSHDFPAANMSLLVRTAGDPAAAATAVRSRIVGLDRDIAVSQVASMDEVLEYATWQQRFFAVLFVAFAALALVLAATGLYGVMAYAVSRRRQELGLRVALGASAGDLRRLVLGQALRLSLLGVSLGCLAALALTRLLVSQLYQVKPGDPATYGAMALLLLAVALVASYLPARRAARTAPMEALQER